MFRVERGWQDTGLLFRDLLSHQERQIKTKDPIKTREIYKAKTSSDHWDGWKWDWDDPSPKSLKEKQTGILACFQ